MEPAVPKIMIVDDFPQQAVLLGCFLSSHGYEAACAHDGREAIQLLEQKTLDVILSDVCMPGMDGYELLDYVRSKSAATRVILMSGGFSFQPMLGRRRVPDAFLTKPFDTSKLLETIQAVLHSQTASASTHLLPAL